MTDMGNECWNRRLKNEKIISDGDEFYRCSSPGKHSYCEMALLTQYNEKICMFDTCAKSDLRCDQIKPIETKYKGYRFRSRLEARWAIFLDILGIKWEYEMEGYDLGGNIGYYLPDFWLPVHKSFLEIKPEYSDDIYTMCQEFTRVVNNPIILICGPPWDYEGRWFTWDTNESGGGENCFQIALTEDFIMVDDNSSSRTFCMNSNLNSHSPQIFKSVYELKQLNSFRNLYDWADFKFYSHKICLGASDKAKTARFEFGETPQPPRSQSTMFDMG